MDTLYGLLCRHGVRIMAPAPDDDNPYPKLLIVEPWPRTAPGCTYEALVAALEENEISYLADLYREYLLGVGWSPPLGHRLN